MQTQEKMVFAGAVADSTCLYGSVSHAINLVLPSTGDIYEVEVLSGSFDELAEQILANPWWGNKILAAEAAREWGQELWDEFGALGHSLDADLYLFATQECQGKIDFQGTFSGRAMGRDSIRRDDADSYAIATLVHRSQAPYPSQQQGWFWGW